MLRERKYNIGVMPGLLGLTFGRGVLMLAVTMLSVIAAILLATFSGAGVWSLLALAIPMGLYVPFKRTGKKVKGVAAVRAGAWLHGLETAMLLRKLDKQVYGKEVK
ncbi:MAG: hypothetical protein LBK47_08020 [Prevotellaceae bacterium]|jgi:hypothetical protein|nr:hypothetical protein [Prevotellaceae bacterium]